MKSSRVFCNGKATLPGPLAGRGSEQGGNKKLLPEANDSPYSLSLWHLVLFLRAAVTNVIS